MPAESSNRLKSAAIKSSRSPAVITINFIIGIIGEKEKYLLLRRLTAFLDDHAFNALPYDHFQRFHTSPLTAVVRHICCQPVVYEVLCKDFF